MHSEIFPDPNLLFRFKIDMLRLADIESIADVHAWGLTDQHRMPPIDRFSISHSPLPVQFGWNPQGLFLRFEIDPTLSAHVATGPSRLQIVVEVNSRYNPNLLRENEFCSSFAFISDSLNPWDSPALGDAGVQSMFATKRGTERKPVASSEQSPKSLSGWLRPELSRLTSWIHIGADSMPGYRPEEFPDIALNFDVALVASSMSGPVITWNMVYSYKAGARGNPSLWPHCRLV